ncbi:phosphotransferase enzyme family protein [Promicromonospora sp. NPDC057488]|uniref:phosphotransferase enzyme family protein n=1 Tax=Promicromonospora sp. NPDC057488 TaxID=3346147 RepID=UPI00366FFDF9
MTSVARPSTGRAASGAMIPEMIPRDLWARWRLSDATDLGGSRSRTWRVRRGSTVFALKWLPASVRADWRYETQVMTALRSAGWPAPVLAEEPLVRDDGIWRLFAWLPGGPAPDEGSDDSEGFNRGRLLAEFHAASSPLGAISRRDGFELPREAVSDPLLDQWLTVHERHLPEEGRTLRAYREAAAALLAENGSDLAAALPAGVPGGAAPGLPSGVPSGVVHGDFTPWNLLFESGTLSGILDFEACHHNHLVADFALAWRGDHDDVIRGYDSVRPLSETEWRLVWPTYWAWLFLGVKEILAEHYSRPGGASRPADLDWQVRHLLKDSGLLAATCGPKPVDLA